MNNKVKNCFLVFSFFVSFSFILDSGQAAIIITVCESGCGSTSIQPAINNASVGDEVRITDSRVYFENITINVTGLTLTSNSTSPPVIWSNSTLPVIDMKSRDVILSELSILYNGTGEVGVIYSDVVMNVTIANNTINITGNTNPGQLVGIYSPGLSRFHVAKNNIINMIGNNVGASYGILYHEPNQTFIFNNTIHINDTVDAESIGILMSAWADNGQQTNNNITSNRIHVDTNGDGYASSGIQMELFGRNNAIIGNIITTKGTDGNFGIWQEGINSTIENNTITTNGKRTVGIWLDGTDDSTIKNNTITTNGTIPGNYGLEVGRFSNPSMLTNNNIIIDNTISTNGSSGSNYGIFIRDRSSGNTIRNNRINTYGAGDDNYGIFLGVITISNNNIVSNKISTNGVNNNDGIHINVGEGSNITANIITANGTGTNNFGIHFSRSAPNNMFFDNIITAKSYDIRDSDYWAAKKFFVNTSFNRSDIGFSADSFGKIFFQHRLDVLVQDETGSPVSGATVIGNDNSSVSDIENPTSSFSATTNSTGYIPQQILSEFMTNRTYQMGNYIYFTNYSIRAFNQTHLSNSTEVNLTSDRLITIILRPDTTPPVITIQAPTNNITLTSSSVWGNITLNEVGGTVLRSLDGGANVSLTSSFGNWNNLMTGLSEGSHNVRFYANDPAGNQATLASVNFTVDTIAPTITTQSPTNTTYTINETWANVTLSEAGSIVFRSLNGGSNVSLTNSSGNWNSKMTSLSEGSHRVTFYANDTAGNMAASSTVFFTVDTTAPTITLQQPTNKTFASSTVWTNATLNEVGGAVLRSLDGGANVSLTNSSGNWNNQINSLSDGPHRVTIYANDSVGNQASPLTVFFTVDTTAPIITIQSPTNVTYNVNEIWVNATLNKAGNIVLRSLDGGSNVSLANSSGNWNNKITGLSNGPHRVTAYSNDSVGNNAAPVTIFFTLNATIPVSNTINATSVIVIGNDTSAMRVLNYTWIDEAESNINSNALNMCRNRGSQYNGGFSGEICIFFINFSSVVDDNTTITNATFYLDYGPGWKDNTTFTIVNVINEDHINRYTDSIYSVPPGKYSPTHNNNPCGWTSKTNRGDSSSFNSSCNQTAQAQYFVSKPNTIAGFDVLHMINAARGKTNAILFYLNDSVGSGSLGSNEPIHITNSDGTKRPRLYLEGSGFSPVPPPPAPAPLVTIGLISRNVTSFHIYNETLGIEVRIKSYWPITSANITIYNSTFSVVRPMTLSGGNSTNTNGIWTKKITYNDPVEFRPGNYSLYANTTVGGNYSFYINATDGNTTGNSSLSWFLVHGEIKNAVFAPAKPKQNMSIVIQGNSIFRPNASNTTLTIFAEIIADDYTAFSNTTFDYFVSNSTANVPVLNVTHGYFPFTGDGIGCGDKFGDGNNHDVFFCKFTINQSLIKTNTFYNLTLNATDKWNNIYNPTALFKLSPLVISKSNFNMGLGNNIVDDRSSTNVSLTIQIPSRLSGTVLSIVSYNETPDTIQAYDPFNTSRFVEFVGSWENYYPRPSLEYFWVEIKMYYDSVHISSLGLEESSLKLQFYNETIKEWKTCGGVNTTGKYVFCNSTHFSVWGITGNPTSTAASSSPSSSSGSASSGGGGGGGGSGTAIATTDSTSDTKTVQTEETSKSPEANEIGTGTTGESAPTRNVTNERQENLVTGLFALGGANTLSVILAVIIVGGITSFLLWRKTVRFRKKS